MKVLYYDCFSGISGDMNLGAMLDLGVDKAYLLAELNKLPLTGYKVEITTDARKAISGTKVRIVLEDTQQPKQLGFTLPDSVDMTNIGVKKTISNHSHHHRNLKDIQYIIDKSELNDNVKAISHKMFVLLAEAEAKIHGVTINDIHFHEVGAVDSIVDMVGAAICYDYLKVDKVLCSTVELGGGWVKCAHGQMPVPAPATAELMRGKPVRTGTVQVETTTPTGATILSVLVDEFTDTPHLTIEKTAYGIGHRDTVIPNVLRVYLGTIDNTEVENRKNDYQVEHQVMIACNIDDMNPEWYGFIMEKLFANGAKDVFFTPVTMKKNRVATQISVLCPLTAKSTIIALLLNETTTFGLRSYVVEKTMLQRTWHTLDTPYGKVRIKNGLLNGRIIKSKPEFDDCCKLAIHANVSLRDIYEAIANKAFELGYNNLITNQPL